MVFCCNSTHSHHNESLSDLNSDSSSTTSSDNNNNWPSLLSIKNNINSSPFPFVKLSSRSRSNNKQTSNSYSSMSTGVECTDYIEKEFTKMSIKQREEGYNILHCIPSNDENESKEDPKVIQRLLEEFEHELQRILVLAKGSTNNTFAYNIAKKQSSSYVSNGKFRLQFIRADKYNIQAATQRFIKFFDEKLRLFGLDLLTKENITYDDLTPDDKLSLECGAMQICPIKDRLNRYIFAALGKQKKFITTTNYVKAQFYILMSILQEMDVTAQIRGINIVGFMDDININTNDDWDIIYQTAQMRSCLPIRVALGHVCIQDTRFKPIFELANLPFLDSTTIFACRYHFGTRIECLYALSGFGIPAMALPFSSSSSCQNNNDEYFDLENHNRWLQKRKSIEEHRRTEDGINSNSNDNNIIKRSSYASSTATTSMTNNSNSNSTTTDNGTGAAAADATAETLLLDDDNDNGDFALFDSSSLLEQEQEQEQYDNPINMNMDLSFSYHNDDDDDSDGIIPITTSGTVNDQEQQQQQAGTALQDLMMMLDDHDDHHITTVTASSAHHNADTAASTFIISPENDLVAEDTSIMDTMIVANNIPPSPSVSPRPQSEVEQQQLRGKHDTTMTTTVVSSSSSAATTTTATVLPTTVSSKEQQHDQQRSNNNVILSFDEVNSTDVLLGRGKPLQKWPGNIAFRNYVSERMELYDQANKANKTKIATDIMNIIKSNSKSNNNNNNNNNGNGNGGGGGGRFLQSNYTGPLSNDIMEQTCWEEISDHAARLKVAFTFRSLRKTLKKKNNK